MKQGPREAVLWLAVHHKQREAVEIFSKEIAPAGTGMGNYSSSKNFKVTFYSLSMTSTEKLSHVKLPYVVHSEIIIFKGI